jgi:hypothetical protein
MSLQKVSHIEGLDTFQDVDLHNDDDPGAMKVHFEVRSIEIPAKTLEKGVIVRENWVYIVKNMEVGHSIFGRKIRDSVCFDEASNKWKVLRLAPEMHSDILRYPAEWNAFATGVLPNEVGTPLEVLFKHDPSRVLMYKDRHIETVERLAGVNATDASILGFGVSDDIAKAKAYLAKLNAQASNGVGLLSKLEDQEHEISVLRRTIAEMQQATREPVVKKTRGRPSKKVEFNEESFAP